MGWAATGGVAVSQQSSRAFVLPDGTRRDGLTLSFSGRVRDLEATGIVVLAAGIRGKGILGRPETGPIAFAPVGTVVQAGLALSAAGAVPGDLVAAASLLVGGQLVATVESGLLATVQDVAPDSAPPPSTTRFTFRYPIGTAVVFLGPYTDPNGPRQWGVVSRQIDIYSEPFYEISFTGRFGRQLFFGNFAERQFAPLGPGAPLFSAGMPVALTDEPCPDPASLWQPVGIRWDGVRYRYTLDPWNTNFNRRARLGDVPEELIQFCAEA